MCVSLSSFVFSSNIWNGCVSTSVTYMVRGDSDPQSILCDFQKKKNQERNPCFFFCLAAVYAFLWRGFLLLFVVYFYLRIASFYFFFSMPDNCTMYNLVLVLRLGIMCLFCDSALVVVVFYPRSDSSSSIQCPMIVNNV